MATAKDKNTPAKNMQSVQKSRKICAAGAAAGYSAASCCSLPATCTNYFMGGVSGCLTDATHVFGYVRHTRKVGRDSAAAAAAAAAVEVSPARAAADAIARYC